MKTQKIRITQLLVLMALCCAFMVGNSFLPGSVAEAAAKKATLSVSEMTIPVGTMSSKVTWNINSWELRTPEKLAVKNAVKGATYQFKSSNTKVVTISKNGGYLTGVKAGSATITVTQTLKNKKTTVGKCKVTVKSSKLEVYYDNALAIDSYRFNLSDYYAGWEPMFNLTYRNPSAKYSITSSDKNLTIKEVKYDASKAKDVSNNKEYQQVLKDYIGSKYFYGYEFTAKKAGTYTITVKETYNKKTKTVGTFKIEVKDPTLSSSKVELYLGNNMNVFDLIDYEKPLTEYHFFINNFDEVTLDNNVLYLNNDGSQLYLYASKVGTAEVTIREGSEDGALIGTVTINVSEALCEDLYVDETEYTTYVDDYFSIYYNVEPWYTTDKVTIESDNPEVLKVTYDEEDDYWSYSPLKAGEANITIKCGDKSVVCKVTVEEW